jgi:predicted phosphoadenosine phosphosulfate sulfurtransferase
MSTAPDPNRNMKIYSKANVMDAALDRIRWLFDEFPNVVVSVSGGKDSTVVFNLCLQVAREKKRLPLKVMWLDQEAEWQATVDEVTKIMEHPDVQPMWFQVPLRLFNATSATDHWLHCWDPAARDKWIHPQKDYAYTVNRYGTDRFTKLFDQIVYVEFANQPTANIGGVRTEESPSRHLGMTVAPCYKWATWGKVVNAKRKHYTFYPIYDWSYTDVWAAIHKNGWSYNRLYDAQYQHGVSTLDMRVSNVHHETAVKALFSLQEIEPETYARLTQRIAGIDMAGKMGADDYFGGELPFMFSNWGEYRDHLLEKLISNPKWKDSFRKTFQRHERFYGRDFYEEMCRVHISSILTNDHEQIKLANWENMEKIYDMRQAKKRKMSWALK